MTTISVLKPGLLVSLKSSTRGGVAYSRVDVEADHITDDGTRVARWETRRAIEDPIEFEAALTARGKARALVSAVCCPSSFGLLCPVDKEAELRAAIAGAREVAAAHNRDARRTRVEVFVLVGRIARNDAEAARAITSEMRELMEALRQGIRDANPEAIREAASKARALGGMMSPEVSGKVDAAIVEARRAARELVRRVEKAGVDAALVVAACSVQAIEAARFAFLDLDAGTVTQEAPAARGIDLPEDEAEELSGPAIDYRAAELRAAPQPALPFELEV